MKIYKSAKTGQIVSEEFARANPDTTYAQSFDINDAFKAIAKRFNKDEFESEQKIWRDNLDIDALNKARLQAQEKGIVEQIAMLSQESDSEIKENRLYQALDRLSEILYEQGRIKEALDVCPNSERKAFYAKQS